jgi:hypothetical protein
MEPFQVSSVRQKLNTGLKQTADWVKKKPYLSAILIFLLCALLAFPVGALLLRSGQTFALANALLPFSVPQQNNTPPANTTPPCSKNACDFDTFCPPCLEQKTRLRITALSIQRNCKTTKRPFQVAFPVSFHNSFQFSSAHHQQAA